MRLHPVSAAVHRDCHCICSWPDVSHVCPLLMWEHVHLQKKPELALGNMVRLRLAASPSEEHVGHVVLADAARSVCMLAMTGLFWSAVAAAAGYVCLDCSSSARCARVYLLYTLLAPPERICAHSSPKMHAHPCCSGVMLQ